MDNKIIRDVIYGDINFSEKFIKLIDTPEFQRLHRIKQLSTAYLIFPSAVHTRFSHSIGTYYVMNKLINHFEKIFNEIGEEITDKEKELALCAALLHDIGHGPFSHAFENAFPKEMKVDNHEKWSVGIIMSEETDLNKVLKKEFGNDFPEKVAAVIEKKFDIIEDKLELNRLNIFKIISLLISSQLDADRMDYLLRDAYFTSVTNGKYDLERLVRALDLDIKNKEICICVNEKYISTLEQYVLARYHMSKEVYFHPIKCQTEGIVKKIFYRLYELKDKSEYVEYLPKFFKKIFNNEQLNKTDYIELDDIVITYLINKFSRCEDYILSSLCDSFLNRKKYEKLNLFNNDESDIEFFKKKLNELILDKYCEKDIDYMNEYFWIECSIYIEVYKTNKQIEKNIFVRKNDGTLVNITNISNVINIHNSVIESNSDKKDNENEAKKAMVSFINRHMLDKKYNNISEDLEILIKNFQNRNHIEIEKKYLVDKKEVFDKIIETIKNFDNAYKIENNSETQINQVDYYYDTPENSLYNSDTTLRIRNLENKKIITIKKPINHADQRFEFEENIYSDLLYENKGFLLRHLSELQKDINEEALIKKIVIENKRKKCIVVKGKIKFEIAFDNVKFYDNVNSNLIKEEYEIEIELKSDYSHRICLNELTSYIEDNLNIIPSNKSKYSRGMNLIMNKN